MADKKLRQEVGKIKAMNSVSESSYEDEDKKGPLKVLNIGPAGSGKTTVINTLADVDLDGDVILIDLDRGSSILYDKIPKDRRSKFKRVVFGDSIDDPMIFPALKHYLEDLGTKVLREERKVSCIFIDTLTTLGLAIMNDILAANGQAEGIPNQHDYRIQVALLERFILQFCCFPATHLIGINAHVLRDKDEETSQWINSILTTGQLRDKLPTYFQEVYFSYTEGSGDKIKYLWQTAAKRGQIARTQMGLKDASEQSYKDALNLYFKGE